MVPPTQLHRICAHCKKPILKGQLFRDIRVPKGTVPMHDACLDAVSVSTKTPLKLSPKLAASLEPPAPPPKKLSAVPEPIRTIKPKRAGLVVATELREIADKVDAGEIVFVHCFAIHTAKASHKYDSASRLCEGFTVPVEGQMPMLVLGLLRANYLASEDRIIEVGSARDPDFDHYPAG